MGVAPQPGRSESPAPPQPPSFSPAGAGRVARAVHIGILAALSAFGPLCMDMYLPALPELPASLHGTDGAAQLSLSACIIGLAVGQLVIGPLSDARGRKSPLLAGLLVFAVTSAVCALSTSMSLLIATRFVQGASGAAGIVLARATVADMFAGKAAAAYFSSIGAINGLAPMLAPILGAQILRVGTWRTVFWVLAGIGVVLLALTAVVLKESLPPERRGTAGIFGSVRKFPELLADRRFVGYAIAATMVSAAMFGYISASPFLLQDGFGLSAQVFSLCFGANALGIVSLTILGRRLLTVTSSQVLLRWGVGQCLVGAGLLAVALLANLGLVAILICLFIMVSSVGLALPQGSALAMDLHRTSAGSASALIGSAQYAFGAITAPLVGLGNRTAGTALAFVALAAALLAAAGLLLAAAPSRQRRQQ